MCGPAIIPIAGALIGAGASVYSSRKQAQLAEKQQKEQERLAQRQEARRAATREQASSTYLDMEEGVGASTGLGDTFLTGAGGISNSQLNLGGKGNLLGN